MAQNQGLPPFPPQAATDRLLFPLSIETGEISSTTAAIRYLLLADSGDQLVATLTRLDSDLLPHLVLTDIQGAPLAEQGADLAGRRSTLKFAVKQRGWYSLTVTHDAGASAGHFRLETAGLTAEIYTVLPAKAPPVAPDAPAVLRPISIQLAKADQTSYWVVVDKGQRLDVKVEKAGQVQITISAVDNSVLMTKQGVNALDVINPAPAAGWELVTVKTDGPALLTIQGIDAAGKAFPLAPEPLLGFVTLTPTATATRTLTPTNTFTPSPTPLPTLTPTPLPLVQCPGNLPARLTVGNTGRVTPNGSANSLRVGPNTNMARINSIPQGDPFQVIGGPKCGSSFTWYQVSWQGLTGWTAESLRGQYWLEPVNTSVLPAGFVQRCPDAMPSIIGPNEAAQILSGGAGVPLNSLAGGVSDVPNNRTLAQLYNGAQLTVKGEAQCVNGVTWWPVQSGTHPGWIPEAQDGIYFVIPVTNAAP